MKIAQDQARKIGNKLKVDWNKVNIEQLRMGIQAESEHRNVVGNSMTNWAKIALAHLKEIPDYYTRLLKMEKGGTK
jgi:hypothetical protein